MSATIVYVYWRSDLIGAFEADPATAWRCAIAEVRARAYSRGQRGGEWYRTANRDGYQVGDFRATQCIARGMVAP